MTISQFARTALGFALAAGVFTYVAGERLGRAFYAWHAEWVGTVAFVAPEALQEPPVIEAPAPVQIDLSTHKVVELRRMAKGLAKGVHMMRKAELLELLAHA